MEVQNTELNTLIINSGLPETKTIEIAENLSTFFKMAYEWSEKINDIVITDPNQIREMKLARESRLMLRGYRLDAEKIIKEKREILKEKMADDILFDKLLLNANKMIKATFENLETKLQEKEKFAERWEAEEREKLKQKRYSEIVRFVDDVSVYAVEKLNEQEFEKLKTKLESEHEQKLILQQQQAEANELKRRQSEMLNAGFLWNGSNFVFMTIEISPTQLKEMSLNEFNSAIKEAKELIQEINKTSVVKEEPKKEAPTPTEPEQKKSSKSVKLEFLEYIDSMTIELPFGALEVADEIEQKFQGFKKWAKNLVLTQIN